MAGVFANPAAEPNGLPPRRVVLFTDTLADVNGVARFVGDMARESIRGGRDLTVVTSTDLAMAPATNVVNLPPRAAWSMPGYPMLRVVPPPLRRAARIVNELRPSAVHVSTPGPVGLAGLVAARRARIPILGTYHTDFPAYVDHLFGNPSLEWLAREAMGAFYRPMSRVLVRSADYARRVLSLGVHCRGIKLLRPGTDIEAFHPRHREAGIWERLGLDARTIKVLALGRVSVEKNLPLLARAWPSARRELAASGVPAELVVVGDGPYRAPMERELAAESVRFLGFRHGAELSAIYASSDMMVFPSATDTLGQVAMEAQASGIPVLVSDAGGPREMVRAGVTGLVLPAERAEAWSRAIVELGRDRSRRAAMGSAGRAHMESYSITRSFEHWWEEHERVAARGR